MQKLFLYLLLGSIAAGSVATAEARSSYRRGYDSDRYERRQRYVEPTRSLYFIERGRPVRRVVYVGRDGRYYKIIRGKRYVVRERYFTSYPSRYFHPDGRRRVGIRISF